MNDEIPTYDWLICAFIGALILIALAVILAAGL